MKKQLSYILTSFCFGLVVSGCSEDFATPETEANAVPITFSTAKVSVSNGEQVQSRAAGAKFPNEGKIAIVAQSSVATTTDWSSLYLNHAVATAADEANGSHAITLDPTAYWPFNSNETLTFTAYSPAAHAAMKKKEDTGALASLKATELELTATTDKGFPDLLYLEQPVGKGNNAVGPYNKAHGTVALGEFKHAMAKVKIKVMCVKYDATGTEATYNKLNMNITSLTIGTKVTKGTFDFLIPAWTLTAPAVDATTLYTLINSSTKMTQAYESTGDYYLFPTAGGVDVAANSEIKITLDDGTVPHEYTQTISVFKINNTTTPVTLTQGEEQLLTIKIKVMDIPNGAVPGIILEGTLIDWENKGNSTVTIQ